MGSPQSLTFEGGTEVLVEVGTNNYISLPRWYVLGEDGTAVIRDWQLNGEIIRKTGKTEEKVVPVKTAAGLTKTMARDGRYNRGRRAATCVRRYCGFP